jgi:hypothetical protein
MRTRMHTSMHKHGCANAANGWPMKPRD